MRTGQMCQHIAFKTIEHHRPQVCMSVGFVLTSDPTLTGVAHNGLRYSLMSAWCQKQTLPELGCYVSEADARRLGLYSNQ